MELVGYQHSHCTGTREKLSSGLEDLSAIVVLLGNSLVIVLERAVVKLHCTHGFDDERVVMLIWSRLNDCDTERRVVFFEPRGQDAARKAAAKYEIVRHSV